VFLFDRCSSFPFIFMLGLGLSGSVRESFFTMAARNPARGSRLNRKHLEGTRIRELYQQWDRSNGREGADPGNQDPGYIRDNIYNKAGDRWEVFRQFSEKNFIPWARRCGAEWLTNRTQSGRRRSAAAAAPAAAPAAAAAPAPAPAAGGKFIVVCSSSKSWSSHTFFSP